MSNTRKPKVQIQVMKLVHQIAPDDLIHLLDIIPRLVQRVEDGVAKQGTPIAGVTVKILVEQEFMPKKEDRRG